MAEDVLDQLSSVIGRKVQPVAAKKPQANPAEERAAQSYARNKAWAKTGSYVTKLPSQQESKFQPWAKAHPELVQGEIDSPTPDYDVRGRWLAEQNGDPLAKLVRSPF